MPALAPACSASGSFLTGQQQHMHPKARVLGEQRQPKLHAFVVLPLTVVTQSHLHYTTDDVSAQALLKSSFHECTGSL